MKRAFKKSVITVLAMIALASCGKANVKSSEPLPNTSETTSEVESSTVEENSEEVIAKYKVTFNNYDGTLLYETEVEEGQSAEYVGETPTRPAEEGADYTYEFKGWDADLSIILTDITTTAVFEPKANEGWGDIIWF